MIEQKPAFADIPEPLLDDISKLLGARVLSGETVYGGFSAAANFLLSLGDGRKIFAKGSHPRDDSHAVKTLRREVAVYAQAPLLRDISPPFRGVVSDGDEDGWTLGLWDYIPVTAAHPVPANAVIPLLKWQAADAPFLEDAATQNYMRDFFTAEKKWARIRDDAAARAQFESLFGRQDAAAAWLDRNLPALLAGQARVATMQAMTGPLHGDLRCDNVLHAADGRVLLVDWPNACRGPLVFDRLFLGASHEALGLATTRDILDACAAGGGGAETPGNTIAVACALSGYFAVMAGRKVPEKMPRLRRMQAGMLRGLLGFLEQAHITESLPGMKNH